MNLFDLLILAAAAACCFAYVCRLDALHVARHHPAIVVLHVGLAGIAFESGINAAHAAADLQDLLAVAAAGAWIVVSRSSWANGVPAHFARRRLELVQREPERNVARIKS